MNRVHRSVARSLAPALAFVLALSSASSVGAAPGDLLRSIDNPVPGTLAHRFGDSLHGAGSSLLVGAQDAERAGVRGAGVAYLFDAATGALRATLDSPAPQNGGGFGSAVRIAGERLAVGEAEFDGAGANQGRVHVFSATGAFERTIENPAPGINALFGAALASDGATLAVGAPQGGAPTRPGAVYLFDLASGNLLRTIASPTGQSAGLFGTALEYAGANLAASAPGMFNLQAFNVGLVYVFAPDGSLVATIANPTAGGSLTDFGRSLAWNGARLAIGEPGYTAIPPTGQPLRSGAFHLADATTGAIAATRRNPDPGELEEFGWSVVALGERFAVGEPGYADAGAERGRFHFADGAGALLASVVNPGGATEEFAGALAAVGTDVAVGAHRYPEGDNVGRVLVFEGFGGGPSPTPTPTPEPALTNISTRGFVGSGAEAMIPGIIVTGSGTKRVLISGIGPNLQDFGIAGFLENPSLALLQGQTVLQANDDWRASPLAADIAATGLAPTRDPESALLAELAPGEYTALLSGVAGGTGVGLVQVFDLGGEARLANISTRLPVGGGDRVMIAGVRVAGPNPKRILVRGLGPTLTGFGVQGVLADPELGLFSEQTPVAANANWGEAPNAEEIAASGFAPPDPAEPAVLLRLDPGDYTAVLSGAEGAGGVGLVEVYELP